VKLGAAPTGPTRGWAAGRSSSSGPSRSAVAVRLEQDVARSQDWLRLPSSVRTMPVADAQATLREVALYYLAGQAAPADASTTVRARVMVDALLGSGRVTLADVADGLDLAPRTLQRRLADEGTNLAAVVDEARQQRALHLLADPSVTMADVAASVEFADQATLSRAGRRWWGMSPTEKRQELSSTPTSLAP